jgi:hypothetical protein
MVGTIADTDADLGAEKPIDLPSWMPGFTDANPPTSSYDTSARLGPTEPAEREAMTRSATTSYPDDIADRFALTESDSDQLWRQDDIDRLLLDLQESLPDVGRLFDGSIGQLQPQNGLTGFPGAGH